MIPDENICIEKEAMRHKSPETKRRILHAYLMRRFPHPPETLAGIPSPSRTGSVMILDSTHTVMGHKKRLVYVGIEILPDKSMSWVVTRLQPNGLEGD